MSLLNLCIKKIVNRNVLKSSFLTQNEAFSTSRGAFSRIKLENIHVTTPEVLTQKYGDTKPVVLVLGWLGCQDKHLQKYSKIYENRGLTTVRYTAPMEALFIRKSKILDISEEILRTIESHGLIDRPIILHTFSNGGAFCFRYISSVAERTKRKVSIKGHIFDSGPCRMTTNVGTFFNVMHEVFGKDKFYSSFLATIVVSVLVLLRAIELPLKILLQLVKNPNHHIYVDPYQVLIRDKRKFPQMFLYSKEDQLMPWKDVEAFARERKEQGVDVNCFCFEGSAHVSHFMKFPELYVKKIDEFLEKCLKDK